MGSWGGRMDDRGWGWVMGNGSMLCWGGERGEAEAVVLHT